MPEATTPATIGSGSAWIRGRRPSARVRISFLGALALAAIALLTVGFVVPASIDAPTLRANIETVLTLGALAAVWLVRHHFVQTRRRRDLLLLAAVLTLALVRLSAYALPAALDLPAGSYLVATGLWGEFFVAAMFAAAAFATRDQLVLRVRRADLLVVALSVSAVAISGLAGLLFRGALVGEPTGGFGIRGALHYPLALLLVLGTAALFARAAIGFARSDRAWTSHTGPLLAGAAMLLGGARFAYLSGNLPPDSVALTEVLRMLGLGLILATGARWELHGRSLAARSSAIAERRRVARDLHDGLAQDLAFIAANGAQLAVALGDDHSVVIAARRALQTSRSAIAELSDPAGATAHEALEVVADELRKRFEIAIALDVQLTRDLSRDVQENLSRIAREAIANAARHGDAEHVVVSLREADGALRLRVRDDGRGFANCDGKPAPEGFGLRSMRERASALGGHMTVRQPGVRGTELDVVLP